MGWNDRLPDLEGIATGIALRAKALEQCRIHSDVIISRGDPDANGHAYALATIEWQKGEIECEREELMEAVKSAIERAAEDRCPSCQSSMDD